jgi:ribosomal protein S27AE
MDDFLRTQINNRTYKELQITMVKRKTNIVTELEEKNSGHASLIKEKNNNGEVDNEIDCPRCHDVMALQSDFARLGYACERCDFHLYLN